MIFAPKNQQGQIRVSGRRVRPLKTAPGERVSWENDYAAIGGRAGEISAHGRAGVKAETVYEGLV